EVNERAKAEKKLLEAQKIARIGSWEWDIVEDKITWSDKLYHIFGREQEDFDGTYDKYLTFLAPKDKDFVNARIQQAFDNMKPFSFEHRIIRPDGTERIVLSRGEVITDESGKFIKMIGTAQDITAEIKIQNTLLESEEKFRNSFDYASIGMALLNLDGNWLK